MDRDRFRHLAIEYGALLVLLFLVLIGIHATVGRQNLWLELLVLLVISFLYRPVLVALGIVPETREE